VWRTGVNVALLSLGHACADIHFLPSRFKRMFWRKTAYNTVYRALGSHHQFADETLHLQPVPDTASAAESIQVWRTASGTDERLTEVTPLRFAPGLAPGGQPAVVIDAGVKYQTFMGFGGSFTESSAELFMDLAEAQQKTLLEAYFSKEAGLGYRLGRLHMNSCDFSHGHWSCDDVPGDLELLHFNISRYEVAILPLVRRAQEEAGEKLDLLISPWSPPGWMKREGRMHWGGTLRPEYREVWAKFYVRFAEEMEKRGLTPWGFTVQNEPAAVTPWENCLYSAEEERDFVRDHLGPALHNAYPEMKLLVWDHNRDDMFLRAQTIYADEAAAKHVWGVGYHWYGDPRYEFWPPLEGMVCFNNLQKVHDLRPDKHIIMTEACQEMGPLIGSWDLGERYGESIIQDLNSHLEAWIDWNLLLNEEGGPNHVWNHVSAPVIVDTVRKKLLFLSSYYYIGHFSRFIVPGSVRLLSASNRDSLQSTAFMTPSGKIVVVVMNQESSPIEFYLQHAGQHARAEMPAHSISTFMFSA